MSERVIFFDLDGPILDVSERYFRVHKDVLQALGSRCLASSKSSYWKMKRGRRPLSAILSNFSESPVDEISYSKLWLENIESADYLRLDTVVPGARKKLTELKNSFDLVLVTLRQSRSGLDEELSTLRLRPLFTHVLSAAPLRTNSWEVKRDLIVSSGLLTLPGCIVGDSEVDILAGKSLDLKTIAVLSGIHDLKSLEKFAPDLIVRDISRLKRQLLTQPEVESVAENSARTRKPAAY